MSEQDLPNPVSREDSYLAAILDEIRGMRADLKKYGIPPDVRPGVEKTVELHEGADAPAAVEAPAEPASERKQKRRKR